MNFGNIKPYSIENGPGVRVSLFVSGCRNCCKGCFSEHTWKFDSGEAFTEDIEEYVLEELGHIYIDGLTVLGGEPMESENQAGLLPFLKKVREKLPKKTIWMYTGFRLEKGPEGFVLNDYEKTGKIAERANTEILSELLAQLDVLVDGRFEEDKKSLMIRFRGSENQRIINVPETLKTGEIVLREEFMDRRGR